jgi:CBS-domain-containing membrane protein
MTRSHQPLPIVPLQKGASFHKPFQALPETVDINAPATDAMTDFTRTTAYTIFPLESVEAARAKMIHRGVRLLMVVDNENAILGLITATDLSGEKPMQVTRSQGIPYEDVLVKDVMTPRERLECLCIDDLSNASVGSVVATLQKQGRQHAMVVERSADRSQIVRGLFSISQISRQLGAAMPHLTSAATFADIHQELND